MLLYILGPLIMPVILALYEHMFLFSHQKVNDGSFDIKLPFFPQFLRYVLFNSLINLLF